MPLHHQVRAELRLFLLVAAVIADDFEIYTNSDCFTVMKTWGNGTGAVGRRAALSFRVQMELGSSASQSCQLNTGDEVM